MTSSKLLVSVSIIAVILTATVNATDIYKWVDENGTLHFQGSPPQNTKQPVTLKRLPTYEEDYRESKRSGPEQDTGYPRTHTPATEKPSRAPAVELYVTSWCPHCKRALEFLRSRGIPFDVYDIENDKTAARRMKRLTRESGVPFAVINGKGVQGFSQVTYERALRIHP